MQQGAKRATEVFLSVAARSIAGERIFLGRMADVAARGPRYVFGAFLLERGNVKAPRGLPKLQRSGSGEPLSLQPPRRCDSQRCRTLRLKLSLASRMSRLSASPCRTPVAHEAAEAVLQIQGAALQDVIGQSYFSVAPNFNRNTVCDGSISPSQPRASVTPIFTVAGLSPCESGVKSSLRREVGRVQPVARC